MTHDPTNPFAPRPRSCVPDNRSDELLKQLRALDPGSWLIPANLGFSTEDVRPLYDRGIIELKAQMGMATCRIKPSFSNAEKIANRIVGAFIVEPSEKVRELTMKWIDESIATARAEERERCAKVVNHHRLGARYWTGDSDRVFDTIIEAIHAAPTHEE